MLPRSWARGRRSTSVAASCKASSTALRQQRNAANEKMAKLDKKSPEFAAARDELKALVERIKEGEARAREARGRSRAAAALRSRTRRTRAFPTGPSEADNPVLHTWGDEADVTRSRRSRTGSSATALGILDFEAGAEDHRRALHGAARRGVAAHARRSSTTCSICTRSARLRRGVAAGGRRVARRCAAPASCRSSRRICSSSSMPVGPDHVADNDLFLSPTAEVQVTNLHADQIFEPGELPTQLHRVLAVLPRRGRRRAARTRAASSASTSSTRSSS